MALNSSKKASGFTLVELLIVMVIIGLLAALVGPRMFNKVGKSKQKAAKAQISLFETALDTYRLDVGRYPLDRGRSGGIAKTTAGCGEVGRPLSAQINPIGIPGDTPMNTNLPSDHGDFEIVSLGQRRCPGW